MKIFLVFVFITLAAVVTASLQEKFSWRQVEFEWPNKQAEKFAIASGQYVVENNLPLGLEKWRNKLFITVPRWKSGVASSLNYVDLRSTSRSPKLIPYPSWGANSISTQLKDNSSIISTFRIQADKCDRLWVIDTGLVDILGEPKQVGENAILIFDLNTDTLIRRYVIPQSQIKQDTFFANIIVDAEQSDCSNAYAYVPDFAGYGVIVYSFHNDDSYRVQHNFFYFDPLQGNFNVDGINFQWQDGVFGMAIGPMNLDQSKDVYFHALSSTKEFKVSNRVLQNKTLATSPGAYYEFKYVGDRGRNGQSSSAVYDEGTDAVFYTLPNQDAIGCWNVEKPYDWHTQGIVDYDEQMLVFPNDLKIDSDGFIWVLSDKMPTFIFSKLDPTAINYRVLIGNTRELVRNTPCESNRHQLTPRHMFPLYI